MNLTARAVRRAAVAVSACAAIATPAIALAAPQPAVTTRSAAVLPVCQPSGLVIWLDTKGVTAGSGVSRHTVYNLRFTNLSGHVCTLDGFPYVYAINLAGHQVGHIATFTGTSSAVTLGRAATVHAVLQVADVSAIPDCHPAYAAGLKVFAPTGVADTAKVVPFPFRTCSAASKVVLHFSKPVIPGLGAP